MKLRVTQERLAQALTIVGRVATTRSALPVLANVLLRAEKNHLLVIATNLEIAITQVIPGKIEKTGAITVPARLFADYISSIPAESIDLELENNKLHIKAGDYTSTVNGVSAEEFPNLPNIKNGNSFTIDAAELKQALQQTVLAASNDETRPVLTGIYFHTHKNKIFIASTDSYRLAQKELSTKPEGEFELIVPANAIGDVLRIIGDGGSSNDIQIIYDDSQIKFLFDNSQLITRQIDGSFPQYRQLIPETSDVNFSINKQEFINITKVASLFARESAGSITIEVSEENQAVSINSVASQVGENTSKAKAKVKGEGKITLNSRYLLEALNVISENEVNFRFSGKISPCVLSPAKEKDYLHIIMPLKS